MVDVVNSTRGSWVGVGTNVLLINSQGDMAVLFGIESLPLCRDPKVLRARDDSRRSCSGRGANWHYYRIVDELPEEEFAAALEAIEARPGDPMVRVLDEAPLEDEEISAEEEVAVREAREETAAGGTLLSSDEIGREFGIG